MEQIKFLRDRKGVKEKDRGAEKGCITLAWMIFSLGVKSLRSILQYQREMVVLSVEVTRQPEYSANSRR